MHFSKPPQTYSEQLKILIGRGLAVSDQPFALHCLKHLHYYRLSAYRFPFVKSDNPDQFLAGVTFEDLWKLYHFDRTLRRLILDASKRVEISVRSIWAYVLGHKYGPLAYEKSSVFKDAVKHKIQLSKLDEELSRSKEDFVKHFKTKYGMYRPPIWAVCEICSLGQISYFYKSIRTRQDRKAISDTYGIDEIVLASFLHHLTIVRNHAAHHGRVWNRKFTITFRRPNFPNELAQNFSSKPEADRTIYNTLTMLLYLINIIEPESHLPKQLQAHIACLDASFLPLMGFPGDWKERPLWIASQSSSSGDINI